MTFRRSIVLLVAMASVVASCGDGGDAATEDGDASIVVTTSVLGDVVASMVGDLAVVTTIMEPGTNPHDFQPSARQIDAMTSADALIVNGAGFEEGLSDNIQAAEADGPPTHAAISAVAALETEGHGHGHEHEHEGGEGEHEGEHDGEEATDPHFFTDPSRMAVAVAGIADFLTDNVPVLDTEAFRTQVDDYVSELEQLDAEVEDVLSVVPSDRRVLVTSHDVFAYFADRYDFEVVGTVIPGSSTGEGASAGDLAALADLIEEEGVPAIFADTSSSASRERLPDTLAAEAGTEVRVVELFTESLGDEDSEGATYPAMMRTNARRIADALG